MLTKVIPNECGITEYIRRGETMVAAANEQRERMRRKKFDTIAVHGLYSSQAALESQGSIVEPMVLATSQHFENSDHMEASLAYLMPSWTYSRIANPTVGYLEETLALMEGYGFDGEVSACATSSGMSAIFMATNPFLMRTGYETGPINIVANAKAYGGTFMLFAQRYGVERGIEVRWVCDPLNMDEWEQQVDANTRFIYGEMPTNPSLAVMPLRQLADLAHRYDIPFIVDSTVATPALMRPFQHGADIVVHSVSKSMATSGFAIAGAVLARQDIHTTVGPDDMRENFAMYVKLQPARDFGPGLNPFHALMILNDLRTLRHRMDYMSRSSMKVAEYLEAHPKVERVLYPGLASFEGHQIASEYMWLADGADDYGEAVNRYGHLMSFTVKAGPEAARRMFDRLQMIWRATDLGRIKSVATIPAISTHQQQGDAGRELADVPANLVRLNVGGEHPDDVIADLDQALAGI
jgi:O-acetylhomoserine/O-acetylserine sulfhydrylase-like pyridoxal-dependent enzyme